MKKVLVALILLTVYTTGMLYSSHAVANEAYDELTLLYEQNLKLQFMVDDLQDIRETNHEILRELKKADILRVELE